MTSQPSTHRFGAFSLEADARRLLRDGAEIPLRPKAFELLLLLFNSRPAALSKTDLQSTLWPDAFVTEANLPGLVREIRQALDDDPREPRFVRTVHRYGYAFVAPAESSSERPRVPAAENTTFWIMGDGPMRLTPGANVLGRDPDAAVWFDRPGVSRQHARITIEGDRAVLEDLGSTNGSWLGGVRLDAPVPLTDGDEIRLGPVTVTFRIRRSPPSTEII